jgi:hypothetical protein
VFPETVEAPETRTSTRGADAGTERGKKSQSKLFDLRTESDDNYPLSYSDLTP